MRVHTFGPFAGVLARCIPSSDVWTPEAAVRLGLPGEGLYVTLFDGALAVPFLWSAHWGWCYVGGVRTDGGGSPFRSLGRRPFWGMLSRLRDRTVGLDALEQSLLSCLGDPAAVLLALQVMSS